MCTEQSHTRVVFVTVDPGYDTPEHMKNYLAHFHKDFEGITGSRKQIDRIVDAFHAKYRQISGGGEVDTKNVRRVEKKQTGSSKPDTTSLYSHTVMLYLIDHDGNVRSLDYTGTDLDKSSRRVTEKRRSSLVKIRAILGACKRSCAFASFNALGLLWLAGTLALPLARC